MNASKVQESYAITPPTTGNIGGMCRYVRRLRAPTTIATSPMMAIADGTGFSVRNIVATANATISPPTSIIARPLLFRFSVTRPSFHAVSTYSSLEGRSHERRIRLRPTRKTQLQEHHVLSEERTAALRLARLGSGEFRSPGPDDDHAKEPQQSKYLRGWETNVKIRPIGMTLWAFSCHHWWQQLGRIEMPVLRAVGEFIRHTRSRRINRQLTV
jgi:hypothetical protein